MQARFGEGFFSYFNKKIIYSIRLVPGSNPGQPIIIWKFLLKKKSNSIQYSTFQLNLVYITNYSILMDIAIERIAIYAVMLVDTGI